jgi:hypothetical protein
MAKETLLKTQRNVVLSVLRQLGLEPSDFEWHEAESKQVRDRMVSVLIHRPSIYFYKFDFVYADRRYWHQAIYSPGEESAQGYSNKFWEWKNHLGVIRTEWLPNLKREIEAPDLWAAVSQEKQLVEAASSSKVENTAFTKDELGYISTQLREIKEFLFRTQPLSPEQKIFVEVRFTYLEESASRLGRVDWLNIVIATLFSLAVQVAFPPSAIRELFGFVGSALSQLFGGTPLLPHF